MEKFLSVCDRWLGYRLLECAFGSNREIVILCVGNGKVWYDSFGPLLADALKQQEANVFVYGGAKRPIVASNLDGYLDMLSRYHKNAFIIVADCCFSQSSRGLCIREGQTVVAGFSKSRAALGELSINYMLGKEFISGLENFKEIVRAARLAAEQIKMFC